MDISVTASTLNNGGPSSSLYSTQTMQDEFLDDVKVCNGIPMGEGEHTWSQRDGTDFKVRGPNYLKDKKKIQSLPAFFNLVNVDGFVCWDKDPIEEAIGYVRNQRLRNDMSEYFVAHFDMGEEHIVFTFNQVIEPSEPARKSWEKFKISSDDDRNSLLKLIPMAVEGPWIAKKAIGDKKENLTPAIIGKKLKCVWNSIDENALSFHCIVNSSGPASAILSTVKGSTLSMIIDLAFLIEAKEQCELPEQILGVARIQRIDLNCFRLI